MSDICLHAFVSGRVQGVWYRQSTKEQAIALGLVGWVRNLDDGRVEVMAAGQDKAVRQLEAWLSQGPELANVAEVQAKLVECPEKFECFEVR